MERFNELEDSECRIADNGIHQKLRAYFHGEQIIRTNNIENLMV